MGLLLGIMAVAVVLHYGDLLPVLSEAAARSPVSLSTRQSLERILFLLPVVYATIVFGTRTGAAVLAAVGLILLPRALPGLGRTDHSLFETGGVLVVGSLLVLWVRAQRRELDAVRKSEIETARLYVQLQESERRYRDLFENAGVPLFACSSQGTIVAANRECEELTGRTRQELMTMAVGDLLAPGTAEKQKESDLRIQRGEAVSQPHEVRFVRKDGAERIVSLRTRPVSDGDGARGFQYVAIDVTEQKRMRDNLNVFMRQILTAQEDERKRIALELHDDTVQALLLVAQRLDSLTARPPGPLAVEVAQELHELHEVATQTLTDLRRLIQDLRPHLLDDFGLVPALEWLTDELSRQQGIKARVEVCGSLSGVAPEARLVLFRVAQEALSNVRRHSGADEVAIYLHRHDDTVRMAVSDNGKGFPVPPVISDLAAKGKLGLLGMYERARLLGGTLDIRSQVGEGTTVAVEVPVESAEEAPALSPGEGAALARETTV